MAATISRHLKSKPRALIPHLYHNDHQTFANANIAPHIVPLLNMKKIPILSSQRDAVAREPS